MDTYSIKDVKTVSEESTEETQKRNIKKHVFTFLKAIVSTVLIYYVLSKTNLTEIWSSVKTANLCFGRQRN